MAITEKEAIVSWNDDLEPEIISLDSFPPKLLYIFRRVGKFHKPECAPPIFVEVTGNANGPCGAHSSTGQ